METVKCKVIVKSFSGDVRTFHKEFTGQDSARAYGYNLIHNGELSVLIQGLGIAVDAR